MTTPVFWFLGLSGSGKSTLARAALTHLESGRTTFRGVDRWALLDGDAIREFLGNEIGYAFDDRRRSVKVTGLLASHLAANGVGVIVANISPFHDLRLFMRERIPGYREVYCKCGVATCVARDPKGHYGRQLRDGIKDYIGLDIPFQEPAAPDLVIDTERGTLEQNLAALQDFLVRIGDGEPT